MSGDLLLLFPERRLGHEVLDLAAGRYRPLVVVAEAAEAASFEPRATVAVRDGPTPDLLGSMGSSWPALSAVLFFAGADWLTMRVQGEGTDWSIETASSEHLRLAVADAFLGEVPPGQRLAWVNVAYGRHRRGPRGDLFCGTRYGVRGFRGALELDTRLEGIRLRNVCLNYFLRRGERPACDACVGSEMAEYADRRLERAQVAAFLLEVLESDRDRARRPRDAPSPR